MADVVALILGVVEAFGYGGVAFLTAVESVFPPIPSEVVLPLAGFAAARGVIGFWGAVAAATAGSVVGALVLYLVGSHVGEPRVRAFVDRYGRWLLLDGEDIRRADEWFRRNDWWAVLVGRLVPGIRSFVSLPAGAGRMALGKFTLLTAIGSAAWNLLLIGVGYELGAYWPLVSQWVGRVGTGVWVVLGILLAAFLLRRWWTRRRAAPGRA